MKKMLSCGKWEHIPLNEKETILAQYHVHGNTRTLVVPEKIDGYTVCEIYWQAIKGGSRLEKIVLPATLKRLNGCPYDERCGDVELELDSQNCDLKIQEGGTVTDSTGSVLMWLRKESMMICGGKPEDYENRLKIGFVDEDPTMYYPETEPLKEIGDYALAGCGSICKIVVPEGAERIGTGAFMFCQALERAELPDTVRKIGSFAFKGCGKMERIKLPEKVREISRGLFEDCVSLTKVNAPDSIESVGQHAFKGCVLVDPDNLWFDTWDCRVEQGAFSSCGEILQAFENVGKWQHEKINNTETMIVRYYPKDFEETLIIPEEIDGYTVRAIERRAIRAGRMLKKIVLPATLKRLNGWPCSGGNNFVSLEIDSKNGFLKMHGDGSITDSAGEELMCFPRDFAHHRYEAPKTLKAIGDKAFFGSLNLKEVVLQEGVWRIGRRAFSYCVRLEPIHLPDSVGDIAEDAFRGCSQKVLDSVEEHIRAYEKRMQDRIEEIMDSIDWDSIDL